MPDPEVLVELREFVRQRDWGQFHSPENLAKSISIEAGELLECFQWGGDADRVRVVEELADVLTYCYLMADRLEVDADEVVAHKLKVSRAKYPADSARGKSTKYDRL
jgi:NTP pyrophosphatase (non-canonical NTP hydrolase)